jgi:hypothetical protein
MEPDHVALGLEPEEDRRLALGDPMRLPVPILRQTGRQLGELLRRVEKRLQPDVAVGSLEPADQLVEFHRGHPNSSA